MHTLIRLVMGMMLVAVVATGCAETSMRESAGQYVDNTVITTKVKTELLKDEEIKSLPITVKSYKGEVQLSGFVNSSTVSKRAVKITKAVPGVRKVRNDLVVK